MLSEHFGFGRQQTTDRLHVGLAAWLFDCVDLLTSVRDETKSGYVGKLLFLYVSKYLGRLTFEL